MTNKIQHYRERRTFINNQFVELLDYLENGIKPLKESSTSSLSLLPIPESKHTEHKKVKTKVFIVHGRDTETKTEVARFIEN